MKKKILIIYLLLTITVVVFAKGTNEVTNVSDSDPFAAAKAFYAKTDVTLIVPLGAGGGMDVAARNAAPYLQKLLGAKSVSVVNKVGASGIVAYNYLYNDAKRDGSIICFGSHPSTNEIVQNDSAVKYKSEEFTYLGTVQHTRFALTVVPESKYTNINELKTANSFSIGGFGFNDTMSLYGSLICEIIGNEGNCVIGGYGTAAKTLLAMAQGEVDAYASPMDSLYRYVQSKQCVPILVFGSERDEYWPDVPTIFEVLDVSESERIMLESIPESDRIVFCPPQIPQDRANFIEHCLVQMIDDPSFKQATIDSTGYFSGSRDALETREVCLEVINSADNYRVLDSLIKKWMR